MTTELGSDAFWDRLDADPARLAAEVCAVDLVRLDETLQRHPALRAWVNAAHEAARIAEERAKWELTKARASALVRARAELDPVSKKAKAVAVLEAETELDAAVMELTAALLAAQERRGALRAMADALEDRKDMLIQIAAKARQEAKDY